MLLTILESGSQTSAESHQRLSVLVLTPTSSDGLLSADFTYSLIYFFVTVTSKFGVHLIQFFSSVQSSPSSKE
nr:MAG TPA: hypothetical protein [Caudoviricetes sp.]